jgi:hypothetical protein
MAKFQAIIFHRSFVEIKMLGFRYVAGAEKENHGKDESNDQIFWFDNCLKTCQK